jgi:hypothetical protein
MERKSPPSDVEHTSNANSPSFRQPTFLFFTFVVSLCYGTLACARCECDRSITNQFDCKTAMWRNRCAPSLGYAETLSSEIGGMLERRRFSRSRPTSTDIHIAFIWYGHNQKRDRRVGVVCDRVGCCRESCRCTGIVGARDTRRRSRDSSARLGVFQHSYSHRRLQTVSFRSFSGYQTKKRSLC